MKTASELLGIISRDASSSDIWEMYESELESFEYEYDFPDANNQIRDGGHDMYDNGNKVN